MRTPAAQYICGGVGEGQQNFLFSNHKNKVVGVALFLFATSLQTYTHIMTTITTTCPIQLPFCDFSIYLHI